MNPAAAALVGGRRRGLRSEAPSPVSDRRTTTDQNPMHHPPTYPRRTIMSLLTRDSILTADDLPSEDVPVPEWGGDVRVRTMTGAERDAYESKVAGGGEGKRNLANLRAGLVALTVVDGDGKAVFRKDDVEKLGMKSAKALNRVADVAMRLAGLTDEDAKKLAAEEAVEDFDETPTAPFTSD